MKPETLADFDPNWWTAYDDVTGSPLDPSMVKEAREKEVQVIRDVGVWDVIPLMADVCVHTTRHEGDYWQMGRHQQG